MYLYEMIVFVFYAVLHNVSYLHVLYTVVHIAMYNIHDFSFYHFVWVRE